MTTSLPGVWNLIKGSWDAFVKHWSLLVKYSAWIVLAVALQEVGALIPASQAGLQTSVLLIGGIAGVFVTLWASIRLFQVIFSLEDSKAVTEKTTATAMALILPLVLVGILQGLATLGGFILLIIPGIYIGVRLGFSQLLVIDGNKRGRAALVASWNMTKNRFWAIFGRGLAFGVLFVVLIMVASGIAFALIGSIADLKNETSGAGVFAFGIVNGLIQAAFLPLASTFQVKLYNAVKRVASA